MDIAHYIEHPEDLNKETLFQLREMIARHPYYQTARLLYVQNLFLLHDPLFNEELQRSALLLPDRRVLFDMIEGDKYMQLTATAQTLQDIPDDLSKEEREQAIIDRFLIQEPSDQKTTRKPTPADAATDYTAYLLQLEDAIPEETEKETPQKQNSNQRKASLVTSYINNTPQHIELKEEPEYAPELMPENTQEESADDGYFTETLARIYIKQGRYEKALEIIHHLNLNYPKKNTYFADQIRFLEKLIINNKHNKQTDQP